MNDFLRSDECNAINEKIKDTPFNWGVSLTTWRYQASMGDIWTYHQKAISRLLEEDETCRFALFVCASNDDRTFFHGHGLLLTKLRQSRIDRCFSSALRFWREPLREQSDIDGYRDYVLVGNHNLIVRDSQLIRIQIHPTQSEVQSQFFTQLANACAA